MKKTLISLFMVLVLCLSAIPALAIDANKISPVVLVVDDTAPAKDVISIVNIANELKSDYGIDSQQKLNSEVDMEYIVDKLTVFVYGNDAVIIIGDTAPADNVMLGTKISGWLQEMGIDSTAKLVSEIKSDNLIHAISGAGQETNCEVKVNGKVINEVYAEDRDDCYSQTSFGSRNCDVYADYFSAGENELEQYYNGNDRVNSDVCHVAEPEPEKTCTDSDDGRNYYVKGHTIGFDPQSSPGYQDKDVWDTCAKDHPNYMAEEEFENKLFEYSCRDGKFYSETYYCKYGCYNGVCASEPEEVEEEESEPETGNLPDLVINGVEHKGVIRKSYTGSFYVPYIRFAVTVKNIGEGKALLSPASLGTTGVWGKMNGKDIGWVQLVSEEYPDKYLDAGESRTFMWDYGDSYGNQNLDSYNELALYADRVYDDEHQHYLPNGKVHESNEENNKYTYKFKTEECRDTEIGYSADVDGTLEIYGVKISDSYDSERKMVKEYWCASDFVIGYGYRYPSSAPEEVEEAVEEQVIPEEEEEVVAVPIPATPEVEPIVSPDKCEGNTCYVDSSCVSLGIRLLEDDTPKYCNFDGKLKEQKEDEESCQNNYECLSNTCGNGKCQDFNKRIEALEQEVKETRGLLDKLFSWFSRMFGKQ